MLAHLQEYSRIAVPTMIVLETDDTDSLVLAVAASLERDGTLYVLSAWTVERDTFYQAFESVPGTKFIRVIPENLYGSIHQELCDLLPE